LAQKTVFCIFLFLMPLLLPALFANETSTRNRFNTWDTEHYLFIAEHGYKRGRGVVRFIPSGRLSFALVPG
jgi:hypothetical protein